MIAALVSSATDPLAPPAMVNTPPSPPLCVAVGDAVRVAEAVMEAPGTTGSAEAEDPGTTGSAEAEDPGTAGVAEAEDPGTTGVAEAEDPGAGVVVAVPDNGEAGTQMGTPATPPSDTAV